MSTPILVAVFEICRSTNWWTSCSMVEAECVITDSPARTAPEARNRPPPKPLELVWCEANAKTDRKGRVIAPRNGCGGQSGGHHRVQNISSTKTLGTSDVHP
jgi:hypothetical protein